MEFALTVDSTGLKRRGTIFDSCKRTQHPTVNVQPSHLFAGSWSPVVLGP